MATKSIPVPPAPGAPTGRRDVEPRGHDAAAIPDGASARAAGPAGIAGAMFVLSFAVLLSSLGTSIANVGLPALALDLGDPVADVQWVVLAYLLGMTVFVVIAGRLGDMHGRRRLLIAGAVLFAATSAASAWAPTLWILVACRGAQGIGAAAMIALAMALVADTLPAARTGRAMGLLGTMSAVGTATGPAVGGLLIAVAGWRALFVAMVPLGLLVAGLAWRHLPAARPTRSGPPARFDWPGALAIAFTLAAYALAMTWWRDGPSATGLALTLAAGLGIVAVVAIETKVVAPLIRPDVFRARGIAIGLVATALVSAVVMGTLVVGPFHLAGPLGLDATAVGLAMSCGPIVSALVGVPAGRLVDRFRAGPVATGGLGMMLAGTSALAVIPAGVGIVGYVAPLVVLTGGYALFQAANNTMVMAHAAATQRGVVSGALNLARNLGLVTGAAGLGAVFASTAAAVSGADARLAEIEAGTHAAFAVAAVLVAVALALGRVARRQG